MKKGTKLLSAALALALAASLVSCSGTKGASQSSSSGAPAGSGSKSPEPVKTYTLLMYTDWYKSGWKALNDSINSNSDKTGFKLSIQKIAGGNQGDQVIETKFASGDLPDLIETYSPQWVETNASLDKLVPLSSLSSESQYDSTTLDGYYKANGKLYGMPIDSVVLSGVFYNKQVFSKLGITIPKNWDELLADCAKIKAAGITPVYFSAKDEWTASGIDLVGFSEDVADSGMSFTDYMNQINTNKKHFADCTNFMDLLQKGKDLIGKGYVNSTYLSDTYDNAQEALVDGKAAMYPLGSWVVDEISQKYPDKLDNIGAFPLPTPSGKGYVQLFDPFTISVTTSCKDQPGAIKALDYIESGEAQQVYATAQPGIYLNKNVTVGNLPQADQDLKKVMDSGKAMTDWESELKYSCGDGSGDILSFYTGQLKTPADVAKTMDSEIKKNAQAKNDPNWK